MRLSDGLPTDGEPACCPEQQAVQREFCPLGAGAGRPATRSAGGVCDVRPGRNPGVEVARTLGVPTARCGAACTRLAQLATRAQRGLAMRASKCRKTEALARAFPRRETIRRWPVTLRTARAARASGRAWGLRELGKRCPSSSRVPSDAMRCAPAAVSGRAAAAPGGPVRRWSLAFRCAVRRPRSSLGLRCACSWGGGLVVTPAECPVAKHEPVPSSTRRIERAARRAGQPASAWRRRL